MSVVSDRTSPVLRGAWILENITGTPPAPPPPNVEGRREVEGQKRDDRSRAPRGAQQESSCRACHGIIDPLGFALENFDATGGSARIAHTGTHRRVGQAAGRYALKGPEDLRKAFVARPDQFVQTFTEKLMTYALGRTVEYPDMPTVRRHRGGAAQDNYRFSSLVISIVTSDAFQKKRVPTAGTKIGNESDTRPTAVGAGRAARISVAGRLAMFITKKHLSRRTVLRGVGASVALPLLDAMIPATRRWRRPPRKPKPRMGFIYFPHGAVMIAGRRRRRARLRDAADPQAARSRTEPPDRRQRLRNKGGEAPPRTASWPAPG